MKTSFGNQTADPTIWVKKVSNAKKFQIVPLCLVPTLVMMVVFPLFARNPQLMRSPNNTDQQPQPNTSFFLSSMTSSESQIFNNTLMKTFLGMINPKVINTTKDQLVNVTTDNPSPSPPHFIKLLRIKRGIKRIIKGYNDKRVEPWPTEIYDVTTQLLPTTTNVAATGSMNFTLKCYLFCLLFKIIFL